MHASARPVTAAELIRMSSPGKRFELRRGELIVMVPAGAKHGQVAMRIGYILTEFVDAHGLGTVFGAETGFRLERDPDTVLAPDAAFVSLATMPPGDIPSGYAELAPDLVVEVISPNDTHAEIERKTQSWLGFGVTVVWVVDPLARTVSVFTESGGHQLLGERDLIDADPVLPGFKRPLESFFS